MEWIVGALIIISAVMGGRRFRRFTTNKKSAKVQTKSESNAFRVLEPQEIQNFVSRGAVFHPIIRNNKTSDEWAALESSDPSDSDELRLSRRNLHDVLSKNPLVGKRLKCAGVRFYAEDIPLGLFYQVVVRLHDSKLFIEDLMYSKVRIPAPPPPPQMTEEAKKLPAK